MREPIAYDKNGKAIYEGDMVALGSLRLRIWRGMSEILAAYIREKGMAYEGFAAALSQVELVKEKGNA